MESASTPAPDDPRPPDDGTPGPRRLTRARTDRVLGGVCAGLGRYFGIDPILVRVFAVVLVLLGGAGLFAYLALWLLVAEEPLGSEDTTVVQAPARRVTAGAMAVSAVLLVVAAPLILGGGFVALGLAIPLATLVLTGLSTWWFVSGEPFAGSPGQTAARAMLGLLVLTGCVLLVAAGFFGTGAGGGAVTGAIVAAAGAVLLAGSFGGRLRWVALPAVALALGAGVAAGSGVDLSGGAGDREYRPTTDLADDYELGMGQLVVDLSDTKLRRGRTNVDMRLGMGQAVLIVPRDVCVAVRAKIGAGGMQLFDRGSGGVDYKFRDDPHPPRRSGKRVVLDAEVGMGQVVVSHDRGVIDRRGPHAYQRYRAADASGNTGCSRA